jgi:hypothetical protein
MIFYILGIFVAFYLGFFAAALCAAAKRGSGE